MCLDMDTAMDPVTETFILIRICSDLCHTIQVNRWACLSFVTLLQFLCLFSTFFHASGKACVLQPCLRSATSQRMRQNSSWHWSKKMLLSTTKVLMITALLLPSNRRPTMVSNELVPWMMQGKREGNAQPSLCINTTKKRTQFRMPLRVNRVHTQNSWRTP